MSYNPLRSKLLGQVPEEDKNVPPVYRDTNRLMRVLGFCVFHNNIQKVWGQRSSKLIVESGGLMVTRPTLNKELSSYEKTTPTLEQKQ